MSAEQRANLEKKSECPALPIFGFGTYTILYLYVTYLPTLKSRYRSYRIVVNARVVPCGRGRNVGMVPIYFFIVPLAYGTGTYIPCLKWIALLF